MLDARVFKTRWRWNTTISLAVPRSRGGSKVPPQLQRMQADDLMAAIFPDAAACLENIPAIDEIPDHPLVNQTVRDCLEEAMDFEGLTRVLTRIHAGELVSSRAIRRSRRRLRTRSSTQSRTRFSTMRRSRSGGRTRCRRGWRPIRPEARWVCSTRMPSRACATRSVRIRETPTNCTMRC
jgi:Lhr-like helicase